jgi:hypothetical protein
MGKKTTEKPAKKPSNVDNPWAPAARQARLKSLGGSDFDSFNNVVSNQALQSLWVGNADGEERSKLVNGGVAALIGLAPKDEIEGMLAAQMIAVHSGVMECFRRSMISNQTFEGHQEALTHGGKLARTFTMLLDALERHRGKGAQRIVVERLNVEAGGQAVVGAVSMGGGHDRKIEEQPHAKALGDAREPPMRSADAEREPLPLARSEGPEPLPHARRGEGERRAGGES